MLDNVYVPPQQYQVEFEETSTSNANEVAVNPHVDDPQDFPDNDGHKVSTLCIMLQSRYTLVMNSLQ